VTLGLGIYAVGNVYTHQGLAPFHALEQEGERAGIDVGLDFTLLLGILDYAFPHFYLFILC